MVYFQSPLQKKNPYFNLVEYNKNNFLALSKRPRSAIFSRQKCPKVYEHVASIYCLKPDFIIIVKNHLCKENFLDM